MVIASTFRRCWRRRPAATPYVSGHSEDEAVTAIDLGLRQGLLQAIGETTPTRYAFIHDLVNQAVVSQLSDVRRKLLHRRCAAMLVQEAGRPRSGKHSALAGRVARHAWHGQAFALVWQWALLAAEHAIGLYAYGDALSFYEMALGAFEALRRPGSAKTRPGRASWSELWLCIKRPATWKASAAAAAAWPGQR